MLKLKVTAIVDAALEGLASLTQQDFAAVRPQIFTKIFIEIIIKSITQMVMIIHIIVMIRWELWNSQVLLSSWPWRQFVFLGGLLSDLSLQRKLWFEATSSFELVNWILTKNSFTLWQNLLLANWKKLSIFQFVASTQGHWQTLLVNILQFCNILIG